MRRLTLLLLALSLAVVAPVAHAAPVIPGGPSAHAAQAPGDRDGDGFPDTFDQCPDAPGPIAGCPRPADRDGDAYPDASDACPDTPGPINGCPIPVDRDGDAVPDATDRCPDERGVVNLQGCPGGKSSIDGDGDGALNDVDVCPNMMGKQANGCDPFVTRFFFASKNLKAFAADKPNDTNYCSGGPQVCKTTHLTMTLSAATAKAAGIAKRRIGSVSIDTATKFSGFRRGISAANRTKLARLKKITVTLHVWFTLTTGQTIETPEKRFTLTPHGYALHQFNNVGGGGSEEI